MKLDKQSFQEKIFYCCSYHFFDGGFHTDIMHIGFFLSFWDVELVDVVTGVELVESFLGWWSSKMAVGNAFSLFHIVLGEMS